MSDQSSKDAAAKSRIMNHMNAEHQRELSHYLQHWAKLSPRAAYKPHMRDMTFTTMSIQASNGKFYTVPFNPPLTSWMDARTTAVSMDREARNALNISDVVVTEYIPPTSPLHILVLLSLLYLMVSSACHSYIVPGTFYYDKVLRFFPGGPEWYLWVQKVLLLPVLGIHLVESLWMARSKMPKYGVRRWSGLWWKWVGSCALEGFGAHQRINALVRRTAMDMEKRKH